MATSLRSRLGDLASAFVASVVDAIRDASVEELFAQPAGSGRNSARVASANGRAAGRLARRSGQDIEAVVDQIVELIRQNPKGLRAEEIRSALGLEAKEMPRPLRQGLATGRFTKSGQKRATTYLLKGAKSSPGSKRRGRGGSPRRKGRTSKRGKAAPKKETTPQESATPAS
jgi:hypothetical protein